MAKRDRRTALILGKVSAWRLDRTHVVAKVGFIGQESSTKFTELEPIHVIEIPAGMLIADAAEIARQQLREKIEERLVRIAGKYYWSDDDGTSYEFQLIKARSW